MYDELHNTKRLFLENLVQTLITKLNRNTMFSKAMCNYF